MGHIKTLPWEKREKFHTLMFSKDVNKKNKNSGNSWKQIQLKFKLRRKNKHTMGSLAWIKKFKKEAALEEKKEQERMEEEKLKDEELDFFMKEIDHQAATNTYIHPDIASNENHTTPDATSHEESKKCSQLEHTSGSKSAQACDSLKMKDTYCKRL